MAIQKICSPYISYKPFYRGVSFSHLREARNHGSLLGRILGNPTIFFNDIHNVEYN